MQFETEQTIYNRTVGLKGIDIFGQPIGLIYKGKTTFQTRVGGLFTIILVLLISSKLITDIANMDVSYTVIENTDYENNSVGQDIWRIDTSDVTTAGFLTVHDLMPDIVDVPIE